MPDSAMQAGLRVLAGQLERDHPGLRFFFRPGPVDDLADPVAGGQVGRPLSAPQDLNSAGVDGDGVRPALDAVVADEDDIDHGREDRGSLAA